jgi:hypothetical protein
VQHIDALMDSLTNCYHCYKTPSYQSQIICLKSHYKAKSLIQNLGLRYVTIHLYENGCILYRKEHVVTEQCPSCGQPSYVQKHAKVPKKLFRHFPIIPIFQGLCNGTMKTKVKMDSFDVHLIQKHGFTYIYAT